MGFVHLSTRGTSAASSGSPCRRRVVPQPCVGGDTGPTVSNTSSRSQAALSSVTRGYLTLEVVSLGGLRHMLGFHFDPRNNSRLVELEFFRSSYRDQQASFDEFQRHLAVTFGSARRSGPGDEGFPGMSGMWRARASGTSSSIGSTRRNTSGSDGPEIPARLGLPLPSKRTPVSRLLTRNGSARFSRIEQETVGVSVGFPRS